MASKTHLQGAAGVFAVCSQLCLRDFTPCIPAVDDGVDVILSNGMKLQVKTGFLRNHPGFPYGAYAFDVRRGWKRKGQEIVTNLRDRNYAGIADFVIFVGLNENRFFIVPPHELTGCVWIAPRGRGIKKHRLLEFEDAWHLLDVNGALAAVEQAEEILV